MIVIIAKREMRLFCFLLISFLSLTRVSAQLGKPVSDIDFVQIINGKRTEAIYFYENNWKLFRQIALERGFIKSFKLLSTTADSGSKFDIILITEYNDSIQYKTREENFRLIIKDNSPGGVKLLNNLKPEEFRVNVFSKRGITECENQAKREIKQ